MGRALGDILPLAVAVAIFPVPIIAVLLMVGSDRGPAKGLAFVLAWCAGLTAIGTIVIRVAGIVDAGGTGEAATWVNVLLLGLGLLLLGAAVKQWRNRPSAAEETRMPGWMRTLDQFTVAKAGGIGFALAALNPKNVLLTAAAAAEIAAVGIPGPQQTAVLLVFVLIASAGVLTPLLLSLGLEERSGALLDGLKSWIVRHHAVIMTVLFLLMGAKLIGDAVAGFSS
jgi:threonine/homoserine/homoserine lactone efflux protein